MFTLIAGVIVVILGILLGFVSNSDLAGMMVVVGFAMICIGIDLRRIRKAVAPGVTAHVPPPGAPPAKV